MSALSKLLAERGAEIEALRAAAMRALDFIESEFGPFDEEPPICSATGEARDLAKNIAKALGVTPQPKETDG